MFKDNEVTLGYEVFTVDECKQEIERIDSAILAIDLLVGSTTFLSKMDKLNLLAISNMLRNNRNWIADQVRRTHPELKQKFYTV